MPTTNKFPAPTPRQNRCTAALALVGRQHLLDEKCLIVPSRRIGQQWLESVARAGQPLVNVRLHTVTSFALELAGPRLQNRQLLSPLGRVLLADQLLRNLGQGYLGGLRPSVALAHRLAGALRDLRHAGVEPDDLKRATFEAPAKARDLIKLLQAYRQVLNDRKLVDEADLFTLTQSSTIRAWMPADLELTALERRFLESIPVAVLPVDEPPASEPTDSFNAVGETNELRHVLRQCLANGWPLDEVELLHTDAATYVPALYELSENLKLPVTFADGIPVRYSRPGRALAAWLDWCANDFHQPALVAMVRDELLSTLPGQHAGRLRTLPIGFGRDRYLPKLDEQLAALRFEPNEARQRLHDALVAARGPLSDLLSQPPTLTGASEFLRSHARCGNELDNYAREVLLERIAELSTWSPDNALEWLRAVLDETRVLGLGPRPGHFYVASIANGGHSGRLHTFIVGLDSNRFPASGRPDPVLLDGERSALSKHLPTSDAERRRSAQNFERLRARLRGTVTLSYPMRDVASGSDLFAGIAMKPATTASWAPARQEEALSESEWWLWRLCAPVREPMRLVGECFPHWGRGREAMAQRASEVFTKFDGFVPESGPDLDPNGGTDRLFSPHRLEMLGKCPLKYFFRYGLGLELPEELEIEPRQWLPPAESGQLLHDVFHRYLRDSGKIEAILKERIAHYREKFPPPNEGVFRHECRRLERATKIFAAEQPEMGGRPIDFEVQVSDVAMKLPDGATIHVRGRIDRVDEVPGGLAIWDYKTGSTYPFRPARRDPFVQGRILQHAIYIAMAEKKFGRPVVKFGYFFPTEKGRGERIEFGAVQLTGAPEVLARLRKLVAGGVFLATNKSDDCSFCDYQTICRDIERVTAQSAGKLALPANKVLQPMRELRETP